ncbi:hypothetical protein [Erysipelothrix anatis]|uniref:hypothetical protein n=1 Tax=Erysipelothrix anatis TaxID=2683713 RepID=UPI001407D004|nr:hypothetical protein [Erysipelothrix anatis]
MKNIWIKILPKKTVIQYREMGFTYKEISKKASKLFFLMFLSVTLAIVMAYRVKPMVMALIPIIAGVVLIQTTIFTVNLDYKEFNQKRHFEFLYFFQLLVPHLLQATASSVGLYTVLGKMEERMSVEDNDGNGGILKAGVNRLMIDITNKPKDIEAFKEFARVCSGSDLSEDVAVALYDWQQNSSEPRQLELLKDSINRALDKRVEETMERKMKRFKFYSDRVLLTVVLAGCTILMVVVFYQMNTQFSNL